MNRDIKAALQGLPGLRKLAELHQLREHRAAVVTIANLEG